MTLAKRLNYYRRILPAYLGAGRSQLTFWHETPAINPQATHAQFGPYYMSFREKADYAGHHDTNGIPMLDYRGAIGLQYNPIAIAQWGLANNNIFCETNNESRRGKTIKAANWLTANLEKNPQGLWVWNHHFNWDYRDTLKAPWYSGLAQGQGISLLLRAYAETRDEKYQQAAYRAFISLTKPIADGGVLFEDEEKNLWIEEYLVDPPTHILNGFIWALWGVFDYWLSGECGASAPARETCSADNPVRENPDLTARAIFDRGVQTLLANLPRYDTGYWSLYEQSGTRVKMLASPFYHRLHIVQLRVMATLTGDSRFTQFADRWEAYAKSRTKRARALIEKSAFKLLHY
jgi:heparosan-N-sulfate-glucuronate 5-epimerase